MSLYAAVLTLLFGSTHPALDLLHSHAQLPAQSQQTSSFLCVLCTSPSHCPNSDLFSYIKFPQTILAWSRIYCLCYCGVISHDLNYTIFYFVAVNLLLNPVTFLFLFSAWLNLVFHIFLRGRALCLKNFFVYMLLCFFSILL